MVRPGRISGEGSGGCTTSSVGWGLLVRKVPANQSKRAAVDDGRISYRDWLGNRYADKAAKSAAAAGRLAQEQRRRLVMADKTVDCVMWIAAVGGALGGLDTTHRVAKPNRVFTVAPWLRNNTPMCCGSSSHICRQPGTSADGASPVRCHKRGPLSPTPSLPRIK